MLFEQKQLLRRINLLLHIRHQTSDVDEMSNEMACDSGRPTAISAIVGNQSSSIFSIN